MPTDLGLDLTIQPFALERRTQLISTSAISRDRLQAIDRANIHLAFDNTVTNALQSLRAAAEIGPALFRPLARRISCELHANP